MINSIVNKWVHNGLTCFVRREQFKHTILDIAYEAPCGYVAVPETHPLYGTDCSSDKVHNIHAYGDGLTFGGHIDGVNGWCFGFKMAYWFWDFDFTDWACVRTDNECMRYTNLLADDLVKIGVTDGTNNEYLNDVLSYISTLEICNAR